MRYTKLYKIAGEKRQRFKNAVRSKNAVIDLKTMAIARGDCTRKYDDRIRSYENTIRKILSNKY